MQRGSGEHRQVLAAHQRGSGSRFPIPGVGGGIAFHLPGAGIGPSPGQHLLRRPRGESPGLCPDLHRFLSTGLRALGIGPQGLLDEGWAACRQKGDLPVRKCFRMPCGSGEHRQVLAAHRQGEGLRLPIPGVGGGIAFHLPVSRARASIADVRMHLRMPLRIVSTRRARMLGGFVSSPCCGCRWAPAFESLVEVLVCLIVTAA
mmetsp:Transcript_28533/g.81949  ORF Transcript_28533/g.81949 Transcript_28533/m.81949 type:complete len:203 (-) Transcript_28533:73-681(-)